MRFNNPIYFLEGLEEEELDAEFEAADPNGDNDLDASEEGDFETAG